VIHKSNEYWRAVPGTNIKLFVYRRYPRRNDSDPFLKGADLYAYVGEHRIGHKIQGDWEDRPFNADKWAKDKLTKAIASNKTQIARLKEQVTQLEAVLQDLESDGI